MAYLRLSPAKPEIFRFRTGERVSMGQWVSKKRGDEFFTVGRCTTGEIHGTNASNKEKKILNGTKLEILSDDQYDFNMWIRIVNELRCSTD